VVNTLIRSAATVTPAFVDRGRVAPISPVQGSGLPFAGTGAYAAAAQKNGMTTLGADRKAGSRAPARGRPL
jgi:hypothetical protein